jgi:hypothetical protein
MRKTLWILATLATASACWAQSEAGSADTHGAQARAEILVLGTYHMSNPGRDIYNMQADDALSPKRQQEMTQVIEVLKKFHPTKIAIEADVDSERLQQEYADYVAGKYTLTRNETNQIGYRLA